MTLTRGRITGARDRRAPEGEATPIRTVSTVRSVTSATAAASVRLALAAGILASLAAVFLASPAQGSPTRGAGSAVAKYLAPAGVCQRADDASAPAAVQRRALTCLVNWARAKSGRGELAKSSSLSRAASLKGRRVVSCGSFTHTPCGSHPAAAARQAGYEYGMFGENLYVAAWGTATPRQVVAAWLKSPSHRANVLRPGFRHLGAALVRGDGLFGGEDAVVWIAAFATPR